MDVILTVNTFQRCISMNSQYDALLERIRYIGESGYNCIRINLKQFSDEECDRTHTVLCAIQKMNPFFSNPVKVYIDIPFPYQKYRLQLSEKKLELKKGDLLTISNCLNNNLEKNKVTIEQGFLTGLRKGENITYADGAGVLKIVHVEEQFLKAVALDDFEMYSGKSLYGGNLKEGVLSERIIEFLGSLHQTDIIDGFLLSFCNAGTAKDMFFSYFKDMHPKKYYAKIESNDGIENLDSIIDSFDGVVVARGDLANVCGMENFLRLHNYIANKVMNSNKELIFATDIMTSLEKQSLMSRADLIDLANMLSFNPNALIVNSNIVLKRRLAIVKKNLKIVLK